MKGGVYFFAYPSDAKARNEAHLSEITSVDSIRPGET